MSIYPYVYRIDHPTGEFYIGSRCANKLPALLDFGNKYKTSSKYLSYPFEEYNQTIIAEFFTDSAQSDAYDFEQELIFKNWGNPMLVNKSCYFGKRKWSTAGMKRKPFTAAHRKKLSDANLGKQLSVRA